VGLVEASGGQKRLSYYCESKSRANVYANTLKSMLISVVCVDGPQVDV
jgi:hypothetical protein